MCRFGVIRLEKQGLAIANRIQGELVDAFEGLAEHPGKGHRRSDLTSRDVLFFSVYQYMIVYRRAEWWRSSPSCTANAICSGSSKPDCDHDEKDVLENWSRT